MGLTGSGRRVTDGDGPLWQTAIPGISLSSSPLPALVAIVDATHSSAAASSSSASRINLSGSSGPSVNPDPTTTAIRDLESTTLSLLTLLLINTSSSLSSIDAEIDLLSTAHMSAQIIEEDQERRAVEREEARRKQEGEREGLREEERWRLDMGLVRRKQRGKVGGLIDDRGKVRRREKGDRIVLSKQWADTRSSHSYPTAHSTVHHPPFRGTTGPLRSSSVRC